MGSEINYVTEISPDGQKNYQSETRQGNKIRNEGGPRGGGQLIILLLAQLAASTSAKRCTGKLLN